MRAILYDAGLALQSPSKAAFRLGRHRGKAPARRSRLPTPPIASWPSGTARSSPKRHAGSVACFPPPHQFFFPRDLTDNLKTVWYGREHRGLDDRFGFGIRQSERGGGSFVPWFNAPPGTDQRLGVFYLLSSGNAEQALREDPALHPRRSVPRSCPAITRSPATGTWRPPWPASSKRPRAGTPTTPDFVGDVQEAWAWRSSTWPSSTATATRRTPARCACRDAGDVRRVQAPLRRRDPVPARRGGQHRASARPGPGKEAGHWMYLFPKPVYWTMKRAPAQPFVEDRPPLRPGLSRGRRRRHAPAPRARTRAWPGPRTPGSRARAGRPTSSGTRISTSPTAGWGPRGRRCRPTSRTTSWAARGLDLLDDMANWGQKKYLPGEVDVFKIDHTHELLRPHEHQLHPPRARPRAAVRREAGSPCSTACAPAGSSSPRARS